MNCLALLLGMAGMLVRSFSGAEPHEFAIPVAPAESVQVDVSGEGEPVVLIPGLFGSRYGFRKIVPLLNDVGFRTIVIEPLGIGGSSRPAHADYSLSAQADRIAQVLDRLNVSHALLLAHSLGAAEGFRLAYHRPDLVRGFLAVEGGPAEQAVTPTFRRALRFAPWIKLFGGVHLLQRKTRHMLKSSSGDTTWVTDAVVEGYTSEAARDLDATLKVYLAMANAREPERLAPHLVQIHCPVRLVMGKAPHDGFVNPAEVRLLEHALSGFVIDSVAGAGHFVHEEQPQAVVASLLRLRAELPR